MPLTSFIFGRKPTPVTIANALVVDAANPVVHSRQAQATQFPVEDGSTISDHVQLSNFSLTLTGTISEAPLDTLRALLSGVLGGLIGNEIGGVATAAVSSVARQALAGNALLGGTNSSLEAQVKNRNLSDSGFPKTAWDYLQEVQVNRVPFSIVTSFKEYDNMVITQLSQTQTPNTGGSLRFSLTAEQITVVNTEIIALAESFIERAAAASGATKQSTGKQTTTTPSDNTSGNGSIAYETFFGG